MSRIATSEKQLIENLIIFFEENKRPPFSDEIKNAATYRRKFGTFHHALLVAGIIPVSTILKSGIIINCKYCKKDFKSYNNKGIFCNQSCSAKYNNQFIPKRKPEGFCKTCGNPCSKSKVYCNKDCRKTMTMKKYIYPREINSKRTLKYRLNRKSKFVEYKGGKCIICGYNKCLKALHFHHINPEEKEFNISTANSIATNKVYQELDKCVLLCANCHAEVESGMADVPDHDSGFLPRQGNVYPLDHTSI